MARNLLCGFKILNGQKIDIDIIENPEGLPYVDIIVRVASSGRITGWLSIDKEQLEQITRKLQVSLGEL